MGPEATAECFRSVVENTRAGSDQDHLPVIVASHPGVPDRTEAILRGGEDPTPYLREMAVGLREAGADLLIVPCNTAHFFVEDVDPGIPFVNMLQAAVDAIPGGAKAGLLATDGTIETGIYEEYALPRGIELLLPAEAKQQDVMDVIYGDRGIKAGFSGARLKRQLLDVVDGLEERGAEYVIAGCTEIRVVLRPADLEGVSLIRPIDEAARRAIELAGGETVD
ncbi:amino acid racemase [Candidatus Bipolaricaulota bacterium]|nr:amino acid racemase [Candidatus Bipolaricaulota bacterium]